MCRRVLLAEDEPRVVRTLAPIIGSCGYDVTVARDGNQAIDCLNHGDFEWAILDLMMPYKDGYEVLKWIRNNPLKCELKVALMSAQAEALKDEFVDVKFDCYLTKPVDPDSLARCLA